MKIALLNDTSNYHCGSRAVISVLEKQLQKLNAKIIFRLLSEDTYGNKILNSELYKDADIIIINGEGAMHHGNGLNILMSVIKYLGKKKIYLVNSVWDHQPKELANIISKFDRVFAREIISADTMVLDGVPAKKITIFPDLCIQADVPSGFQKPRGVHYNFYQKIGKTNSFLSWGKGPQTKDKELNITRFNWREFVYSISTARAMYTGLHHGMYACIKARTPFVVFKHNCCKITGVLEYFGVDDSIIVCQNSIQLKRNMNWTLANTQVFETLFDKVEAHPKFELKDYL